MEGGIMIMLQEVIKITLCITIYLNFCQTFVKSYLSYNVIYNLRI